MAGGGRRSSSQLHSVRVPSPPVHVKSGSSNHVETHVAFQLLLGWHRSKANAPPSAPKAGLGGAAAAVCSEEVPGDCITAAHPGSHTSPQASSRWKMIAPACLSAEDYALDCTTRHPKAQLVPPSFNVTPEYRLGAGWGGAGHGALASCVERTDISCASGGRTPGLLLGSGHHACIWREGSALAPAHSRRSRRLARGHAGAPRGTTRGATRGALGGAPRGAARGATRRTARGAT